MSPLNDEVICEGVEELSRQAKSTVQRRIEAARLNAAKALDEHDAAAQDIQNAEQNHCKGDRNACTCVRDVVLEVPGPLTIKREGDSSRTS